MSFVEFSVQTEQRVSCFFNFHVKWLLLRMRLLKELKLFEPSTPYYRKKKRMFELYMCNKLYKEIAKISLFRNRQSMQLKRHCNQEIFRESHHY